MGFCGEGEEMLITQLRDRVVRLEALVADLIADGAHYRQRAEREGLSALEWQPIKTAPHDGKTRIFLTFEGTDTVYCGALEPLGSTQGDTSRSRAVFGMGIVYPTHWLSVPPIPMGYKGRSAAETT